MTKSVELSELRAADRAAMTKAVQALADEFGYSHTLEDRRDGEVFITVATERGLNVSIEFDGRSPQPNVFVVPWYIRGNNDARLDRMFSRVGGEINPVHFQKCTAVNRGFDELLASLRHGFEMVSDGAAFQVPPCAQDAATAAEPDHQTDAAELDRPRG